MYSRLPRTESPSVCQVGGLPKSRRRRTGSRYSGRNKISPDVVPVTCLYGHKMTTGDTDRPRSHTHTPLSHRDPSLSGTGRTLQGWGPAVVVPYK